MLNIKMNQYGDCGWCFCIVCKSENTEPITIAATYHTGENGKGLWLEERECKDIQVLSVDQFALPLNRKSAYTAIRRWSTRYFCIA